MNNGHRSAPPPRWRAWARHQVPYAAFAYAYFPITLTKRVLLHPRRAATDLMVRRFWDRWGWLPRHLPMADGTSPLWVHMNSGGEAVTAHPLLRRLEAAGHAVRLSTDSYDAQAFLRRACGSERVFFPPWDTAWPVRRVVRRLRPRALVFVTNAYFPILLREAKRRGIRTLLVNGVLTRSVGVSNRFLARAVALRAFEALDAIAVQSEGDADAFRALGIPAQRLTVTGRLEGDLASLRLPVEERSTLRRSLGLEDRHRVLIVGSLHPGEEDVVVEAFRQIRADVPDARLVVVPRWLHEAPAMAERLRQRGFRVVQRTALAPGDRAPVSWDILVIDTFGELRTLYGIADVAYIGSSLVPINERKGGHNVLEPLAHGVPPLFGPHMNLWRGPTSRLLRAWPGLEVDSAGSLGRRAVEVLTGAAPMRALQAAGTALIEEERGAMDRTWAFLERWLPVGRA
jgi:3-deoxy-D-manno-octulosonic-acid transferase